MPFALEEERCAHKASEPIGWADRSLLSLMAHIIAQHHSYVRRETTRLESLFVRVLAKDGAKASKIAEIHRVFSLLSEELTSHMLREEQILFPFIQRAAQASPQNRAMAPVPGQSVAKHIANTIAEHDDAAVLLEQIRDLANGFMPPLGASFTLKALYHGLSIFEQDWHRHVHLENNILFLRALALEHAR